MDVAKETAVVWNGLEIAMNGKEFHFLVLGGFNRNLLGIGLMLCWYLARYIAG